MLRKRKTVKGVKSAGSIVFLLSASKGNVNNTGKFWEIKL